MNTVPNSNGVMVNLIKLSGDNTGIYTAWYDTAGNLIAAERASGEIIQYDPVEKGSEIWDRLRNLRP